MNWVFIFIQAVYENFVHEYINKIFKTINTSAVLSLIYEYQLINVIISSSPWARRAGLGKPIPWLNPISWKIKSQLINPNILETLKYSRTENSGKHKHCSKLFASLTHLVSGIFLHVSYTISGKSLGIWVKPKIPLIKQRLLNLKNNFFFI